MGTIIGSFAGQNLTIGKNCIVIGPGAGQDLTSEDYKIRLKTKNVDISDDISEREYKLIKGVIDSLGDLGYFWTAKNTQISNSKMEKALNRIRGNESQGK